MVDVVISGSGLFHPNESISNRELVDSFNEYVNDFNQSNKIKIENGEVEALKKSDVDFIIKASGIESRYVRDKANILDPKKMWPYIPERTDDQLSMQAEAGVIAAKQALKQANKSTDDIDVVIVSCTHKQRDYPSIAIEIQNELGIKGYAFDMGVACSSATFGLQTACDTIIAGRAKAVLVITAEITSGQVNYRDRDSHFIFGEATTAIVVEERQACRVKEAFKIVDSYLETHFSTNIRNNRGAYNRCAPEGMDLPDKMFYQNGRKVFKEVLPMVIQVIKDRLQQYNIESDSVKRYWLHQANINMNRVIAEKLMGKNFDFQRAPVVLNEFANTGAAGSVIAFHRYHRDIAKGEIGVLCSFGAGYSMGCIILEKI